MKETEGSSWTAIVLTCQNKKSAHVVQKGELRRIQVFKVMHNLERNYAFMVILLCMTGDFMEFGVYSFWDLNYE